MHCNPKVKAKLFKDAKSTNRKKSKTFSDEQRTKTHLFPGVILPLKKKTTAKKLFIQSELIKENPTVEDDKLVKKSDLDLDFHKPNSKKSDWTEYIKQEKPKRIELNEHENRKFFKSTIVHNDTQIKLDIFNNIN